MRTFSLLAACMACSTAFAAETMVPLSETYSTTPEGCALYRDGGEPAVLANASPDTMIVTGISILGKNLGCSVEAQAEGQTALSCAGFLGGEYLGSKVRTVAIERIKNAIILTDNSDGSEETIPLCPE